MGFDTVFKRYEIKYLITKEQKEKLLEAMADHVTLDKYGKTTIRNVYLDTNNYRLIRRSIERPDYKEKIRIRSYSQAANDSTVFVELKKKYDKVVYKRRISLTHADAMEYILGGAKPPDSQIMREIDYAVNFYQGIRPAAVVSYERDAFFVRDLPALRITFDSGVRYRADDLDLRHGNGGKILLPEGYSLMEVKTDGAMPLWLSYTLDEYDIFPMSFSKYGKAYADMITKENRGFTNG